MFHAADFSLLVCASEAVTHRIKPMLAGFSSVYCCAAIADIPKGRFSFTWIPDEAFALEAAGAWHSDLGHLLLASTTNTLEDLGLVNANASRYCGWSGFEAHASWEIALGSGVDLTALSTFFQIIGKEKIVVGDFPGFIAPRTIALLANEAWHVWQDGVAMPDDIDMAMQLGTNYPRGPLAWAEHIGVSAIADLLHRLYYPDRLTNIHPNLLKHLSD